MTPLMKLRIGLAICLAAASLAARGGIYTEGPYTSGFAGGGNIPDGGTGGWSDTRNVSDIASGLIIGGVTVTFTISGGYNGDLYGYLSHDGALMPLLNRVGMGTGSSSDMTYYFGYGDSGFTGVTLADSGSINIHNYGGAGVPTGTYAPDSGGLSFSSTFGGLNPNGNWTLFLADLSNGGGQSALTGWSLEITAVPEPVNVALGIFGGIALLVFLVKNQPVRNRVKRWRAAFVQWVDAV
jgi:hypothetical protein